MSAPVAALSVVVPVFNCARYLEQAIGSVAAQRFDGVVQVVAVDDGSTDDSLAVLWELKQKLEHPKLRIEIRSQANRGASAARNRAIAECESDHLVLLDADDALVPEALGFLQGALQKHPQTGLVYCDTVFCDEELQPLYEKRYPDFDRDTLLNCMYTPPTAAHRHVLDAVGGFDESFVRANDYDLALRIAYHGGFDPFVHVREALCLYRRNPNGLVSTSPHDMRTSARRAQQRVRQRQGIAETDQTARGSQRGREDRSPW